MENFDLEALMETIDTASATKFNVVRIINLDAVDVTLEDFKVMLEQAKTIYESEDSCDITVLCVQPREGENTILYSLVNEDEA